MKTLLVLIVGMIPPLISVWVMRKAEARARSRLRIAIERASLTPLVMTPHPPDLQYIGDRTCKFNANSPYVRCAVNPLGPCQECPHYRSPEN
ncbi:DUF6464 family protein [Argonema antarcticum]|uniref:DUF6464 family protein n=1 Tax=Argonema antarcticum TaxID=2942763 RepID=UPI0023DEB659|nr:DUF6464 family protein [Argonema antarcticum]